MKTNIFFSADQETPKDYLVLAVLASLFTITPLGIAALIFSILTILSKKDSKVTEAEKYSNITKILLLIDLALIAIGLVLLFFWVLFLLLISAS